VEEDARLDQLTQESIQRYEMAVEKTREIVDNEQMIRIARCLDEKKRVFVYGVGSSSLVAREFEYRYVRLGLDVEALCDHNEISQNLTRVNSSCLVIGISLSGATTEVIDGLKNAHDKGAMTVLMTMVKTMKLDYADEIVHLAHVKNLTVSHIISPQIPALIMVDVLYTHYINYDKDKKMGRLQETLDNIAFKMEK
jgi:DNA-binding MurR/RpiR family transcriptional regulator